MRRTRYFNISLSGLVLAIFSTVACEAGEIPPPVKKPRDRTGAVQSAPREAAAGEADTSKTASNKNVSSKPAKSEPKTSESKKSEKAPAAAPPAGATNKPASAAAEKTPAPPSVPKEWTAQDIELAKARCAVVLKDIDSVFTTEAPFRVGECGAPAAVRLISIGKNPQISFDPPPILTCDMVAALHTWTTQNVQPLAKKYLGSDIIKIETMSDYSCRMAYGRVNGKLSEHGHANALDIRGFVTAKAQTAYVLEQWGPVQREILAAKIAADKAAAAKAAEAAAAAAAAKIETPAVASSGKGVTPPNEATKGTLIEGVPKVAGSKDKLQSGLGYQPDHLGGPKDKKKAAALPTPPPDDIPTTPTTAEGRVSAFLHAAHDSACKIFGTTLGPEANSEHRNHFHVDMAPRKVTKICD